MTFTDADKAAFIDAVADRINDARHAPLEKCEDCGRLAELRPYGPGGTNVCFPCGMKDEEEAKRQFFKSFKIDIPGLT